MFFFSLVVCGIGLIVIGLYKIDLIAIAVGAVILLTLWVIRRANTGDYEHEAARIRAELIEKAAEDQEKKMGEKQ